MALRSRNKKMERETRGSQDCDTVLMASMLLCWPLELHQSSILTMTGAGSARPGLSLSMWRAASPTPMLCWMTRWGITRLMARPGSPTLVTITCPEPRVTCPESRTASEMLPATASNCAESSSSTDLSGRWMTLLLRLCPDGRSPITMTVYLLLSSSVTILTASKFAKYTPSVSCVTASDSFSFS